MHVKYKVNAKEIKPVMAKKDSRNNDSEDIYVSLGSCYLGYEKRPATRCLGLKQKDKKHQGDNQLLLIKMLVNGLLKGPKSMVKIVEISAQ